MSFEDGWGWMLFEAVAIGEMVWAWFFVGAHAQQEGPGWTLYLRVSFAFTALLFAVLLVLQVRQRLRHRRGLR